ncbi:hypothetical protein SAMN05216316_0351 [Nitrosovibrio sp. Nv6]|nr:hypothetical protein SAMN05216316_0351 [Nitrosovibrio sp. Nv6]
MPIGTQALIAVAGKMARVAYGLIKKHRPSRRFFEESLPSGSSLSVGPRCDVLPIGFSPLSPRI